MYKRVLHLLSQRPGLTGSGVTLDALVRQAHARGWQQWVVVGTPAEEPQPDVGGLESARILPLRFGGRPDLQFDVPGMSDVMPYPSTRFSSMTADQLLAYCEAWRHHLREVVETTQPQLVHVHHIWLLAALVKDLLPPSVPVVNQCHATGLRQLALCPHLAPRVKEGCARNERFLALHQGDAESLGRALGLGAARIHVVGAGYSDALFHPRGRDNHAASDRLIYVGKLSAAKGLPWLLEAVERLARQRPGLKLEVVGSGAGSEAAGLQQRIRAISPRVAVRMHGHLDQRDLAPLLRRCAVCVLPSFYEGLPLVLVEAMACGCRLVATRLPGVAEHLAPYLGAALEMVPLPRIHGVDTPAAEDLPAFVDNLTGALRRALESPPLASRPGLDLKQTLKPFTWEAVFSRVERVWFDLL